MNIVIEPAELVIASSFAIVTIIDVVPLPIVEF